MSVCVEMNETREGFQRVVTGGWSPVTTPGGLRKGKAEVYVL
jgi:hypothetical protein